MTHAFLFLSDFRFQRCHNFKKKFLKSFSLTLKHFRMYLQISYNFKEIRFLKMKYLISCHVAKYVYYCLWLTVTFQAFLKYQLSRDQHYATQPSHPAQPL